MIVHKMKVTITIEKIILDKLVQETGIKSKATAVRMAIIEYLRQRKIEKIKGIKGKLKFDKTAEEIRHYKEF